MKKLIFISLLFCCTQIYAFGHCCSCCRQSAYAAEYDSVIIPISVNYCHA